MLKIEIQGRDAVSATEELMRELSSIEGLEASYETIEEVEKETTLTTIATIVAITAGSMTIGEKLYNWFGKNKNSPENLPSSKIEKVLIVAPNNRRLLIENATLEQVQEIVKIGNKAIK